MTTPSNFLLLHLKQTFLPIIWIFTEGDGIKSRFPFKICSTLYRLMILKIFICSTFYQNIILTSCKQLSQILSERAFHLMCTCIFTKFFCSMTPSQIFCENAWNSTSENISPHFGYCHVEFSFRLFDKVLDITSQLWTQPFSRNKLFRRSKTS